MGQRAEERVGPALVGEAHRQRADRLAVRPVDDPAGQACRARRCRSRRRGTARPPRRPARRGRAARPPRDAATADFASWRVGHVERPAAEDDARTSRRGRPSPSGPGLEAYADQLVGAQAAAGEHGVVLLLGDVVLGAGAEEEEGAHAGSGLHGRAGVQQRVHVVDAPRGQRLAGVLAGARGSAPQGRPGAGEARGRRRLGDAVALDVGPAGREVRVLRSLGEGYDGRDAGVGAVEDLGSTRPASAPGSAGPARRGWSRGWPGRRGRAARRRCARPARPRTAARARRRSCAARRRSRRGRTTACRRRAVPSAAGPVVERRGPRRSSAIALRWAVPSTIAASTTCPCAARARLEEGGEDADDEVGRPAAEVAEQVAREVRPVAVLAEAVERAGGRDVVHVVARRRWLHGPSWPQPVIRP